MRRQRQQQFQRGGGADDENDASADDDFDVNVMNKNEDDDEEKDLEKGAMKPPALPRPMRLLEELKEKMMTCAHENANGTTTSSKYASIECELSSWRETEIIQFLVEKIRKNYYAKTTTNNEDEDPIRVGRVFTAVNEGGLAVLVGEELRDKRSLGSVVRAAAAASAASAEKKDEEDTSSEGGAKKEGTKKKNSDEKNKKKLANVPKIAIATLESPVNLGASDGRNARVVCLVLVPMSSQTLHGNHRHSFEELHRNSALHNDGGDDDNDKDALFGLDRWNKIACIKAAFRSLSRDTDFVSDASDFKRLHSHAKKHSRLPHAFDVLSAVMHGDSTDDKVRLLSAKQRVLDAWEDAVEVLRLSHRNSFLTSIEHRKKNAKDTNANTNSSYEAERTGRFCGGIIDDIKRRSLVYASDWTDGLQTVKTITATLYMYFGCLGPAIAFGGLTYEETGGKLGAMEFLLCQAFVGIVWAIIGGQPELVLRPAGPQTVFIIELYRLSTTKAFNVPFELAMAWTGVWTSIFMLLIACFDYCAIVVRSCTRFTQEIFMVFVSAIFIFEGCKGVGSYFDSAKETYSRDVALFSLILAAVTLQLGLFFGKVRSSPFLLGPLRELTADFGIAFAIVTSCLLAWGSGIDGYEKLSLPSNIKPSDETRSNWLIDLFPSKEEGNRWIIGGAIVPAICLTCLYYIDANVAALLCNKEEAKLRKGVAYHYDFALLSILLFFCSIFGLPFATPSLPHSPQYVRALSEIEEITKNGVTRTKVVTVHEQRLSPLLVNVLVLLSFVLLSLLKEIPMAVLYGLFVLMGINGFYENQFFHRLTMIFMEPRLHPPTSYVRNVPLSRVHGFTFVQVCCVAVIWGVRSTDLCLMFPILIAMLMPLRLLLSKFDGMFTKQQLQLLDVNDEAYLVLDDDDDDSNNNDDDDDDDDDRDDDDGDAFDVNDPGFNNNATDDERRQLVRAAQKAAFDSRAMTLMDFAENGPSLNASSLGSARKPQSSFGTAATPNRYVFPYHSDSKPIKIAQRRTSSYFSDDDLSPRDKSATVSPRRDRPLSPKPSNDNNKNNKSSNSKEEPGSPL